MEKGKMTSSPASAFGPGVNLIGLKFRGKAIISATRKYITLEDGRVFPRKGNRIDHPVGYVLPVPICSSGDGDTVADDL